MVIVKRALYLCCAMKCANIKYIRLRVVTLGMGAKFGRNFLRPAHKQASGQGHKNNSNDKAQDVASHWL